MEIKEADNHAQALIKLHETHEACGIDKNLAYGVGNDMSHSFYVYNDSGREIRYFPKGIGGGIIFIRW